MNIDETVAVLRSIEMFAALPAETLDSLARRCEERQARKDAVVVEQGEEGDALLVLVSGALAVVRLSPTGERMVLHVMRPPESLGELALIDGEPRSARVEATEPSRLLALSRAAFLQLLEDEPALVQPLLRGLARMMRRLTDQTSDHVFLDLGGRLAKTLVQLGDQVRPGNEPVVVEVTQGRLAEMVGGSRQSVNQALASFSQRAMVEVEGRAIRLLDRPGLRRRARLPEPEPVPSGLLPRPTR